jgi:hypothetical protein
MQQFPPRIQLGQLEGTEINTNEILRNLIFSRKKE